MNIDFFGRTYWLLTAEDYEICVKFIDFIELKTMAVGEAYKNFLPFSKEYGLFYGFAERKGKELPMPFFFFRHKENWYSVHPAMRCCTQCGVGFDAVLARSQDLYWGSDNVDEAFKWGMSLPYVDQCPHCGFDENGKGQKFLAIFYDGKVITAVDD